MKLIILHGRLWKIIFENRSILFWSNLSKFLGGVKVLDGYQKWIITFVKNCQLVPKCHFFLPKFPLLVFGRYFNNSGFVNDPCSSLTFFHNTDNPRWVTLLFFNILKFIQVILSKSNNLLYIIKSCNYLGYLSNQRKLCLNFRFKFIWTHKKC